LALSPAASDSTNIAASIEDRRRRKRARAAAGTTEREEEPEEVVPNDGGFFARRAIGAILRGEDRQTLVRGLVRLGCEAIGDGAGEGSAGGPKWKFGFEEFVKAERARERGRLVRVVVEGGEDEEDKIKEDYDGEEDGNDTEGTDVYHGR
jgi:hypothetical protein